MGGERHRMREQSNRPCKFLLSHLESISAWSDDWASCAPCHCHGAHLSLISIILKLWAGRVVIAFKQRLCLLYSCYHAVLG